LTPAASPPPENLWRHTGTSAEFWQEFLGAAARLGGFPAALLLVRPRRDAAAWRKLAPWPSADRARPLAEVADSHANDALLNGSAWRALSRAPGATETPHALLLRLLTHESEEECVAAFLSGPLPEAQVREIVGRLGFLASAPHAYQERRQLTQARGDLARFASVLDLLAVLTAEKHFVSLAITLCNEIATRHRCEKVSLGWLGNDGYARVRAISHTEKFERKMEVVRQIEAAMEEGIDQDDEIVWPPPPDSTQVSREHAACAAARGIAHLCSIPIRQGGKAVAALLCERQSEPFGETDLRLLRLSCDLVSPRLCDLRRRSRWVGARLAESARESAARLIGPTQTWAKLAGLAAAAGLGVLVFGRMEYRVEGKFIVRAEDSRVVSATLDGFIQEVPVEVGERVAAGRELLRLDARDLLLEEASAVADHQRYVREAEKARAEQQLADMQIAQALADQAAARLDLTRHRLDRCVVRAPLDGFLVEGDLRERIGAPVRQGDALFRVAGLNRLYLHLEVDESQVHEITPGLTGEVAFVSQPQVKFPIRVARVDPVAVSKDQGNFFSVRCEAAGPAAAWWRPGMSGVGKVNCGRRSILWVFTRRTVDFLRLRLWW